MPSRMCCCWVSLNAFKNKSNSFVVLRLSNISRFSFCSYDVLSDLMDSISSWLRTLSWKSLSRRPEFFTSILPNRNSYLSRIVFTWRNLSLNPNHKSLLLKIILLIFKNNYLCLCHTSNVTGRHRGPKRKLRVGYRALSMQRTPYLCVALLCCARYIFHRRVWYRALSLRYARIRRSSIILTPMLPLSQISFLWRPLLLS